MTPEASKAEEAARIRERLARLAIERDALEARLVKLDAGASAGKDAGPGGMNDRSPAGEKIALFRLLFRGRDDVYPRRRENPRTRRAGYAPVCENEWKPRLCEKPKVRCGVCPNQAFRLVTDEAIDSHLRGRETLGVYPCWRTAGVGFWRSISTRRPDGAMRARFWPPAAQRGFPRRSSARVRETAGTSGYSSPNPFPRPWPDASAHIF